MRKRGLVVELLTDNVFFDSGQAALKPGALNLLNSLGDVLKAENQHPIVVEGHTDSQPISNSVYPSNWELSGARASSVIRTFATEGVPSGRLSGCAVTAPKTRPPATRPPKGARATGAST